MTGGPRDLPAGFEAAYGRPPEVRAEAPGRVNLIGEHVDYNGGSVLPTTLPRRARIEVAGRRDRCVRAVSADFPSSGAGPNGAETFALGSEAKRGDWVDYVQGATVVLRDNGFHLDGFDAWIQSDVPIGSGLSSSAALLVALLRSLRELFRLPIEEVSVALLAQSVENEFVGARVGIMDPMIASLGREGCALLLRTRDLEYRQVPIPASIDVVVVDSGQRHSHASGGYNLRRSECEIAARLLEVEYLCDLPFEQWARIESLPPPLDRRVRHAVTEDRRVQAFAAALEAGQVDDLGALLDDSHRSLRDDYEVSTPAIDLLASCLRAQPGVHGARLTGGGFGGAVVAVARSGSGESAARAAACDYERRSNRQATVVVPRGEGS
jgi:galactokinase